MNTINYLSVAHTCIAVDMQTLACVHDHALIDSQNLFLYRRRLKTTAVNLLTKTALLAKTASDGKMARIGERGGGGGGGGGAFSYCTRRHVLYHCGSN